MKKEEKNAQTDQNDEQEKDVNSKNQNANVKEVSETEQLKENYDQLYDKYLRLMSEFENYRRRTGSEKLNLIKNASEELVVSLLPVLDDFERAIQALEKVKSDSLNPDGIILVYNKLKSTLEKQGLKAIVAKNQDFDTEKHEAIVKVAAPSKKMKGKVIEEVEKGYYLNEKIIRYAKVVVGE